jgi:WD40 repeat protein
VEIRVNFLNEMIRLSVMNRISTILVIGFLYPGLVSCENRNDTVATSEQQNLPTLLPTETPAWWQNVTEQPTINKIPLEEAPENRGQIFSIAISPNGEMVAVSTLKGLWIYETNALTPLAFYKDLFGQYIAWTPDSSELLLWYAHSNLWALTIYNLETSQSRLFQLQELPPKPGGGIDWTSEENLLAFTSRTGVVYVWDVLNARQLWTIDIEPDGSYRLAWSPDNQLLATAVNGSITIWDQNSQQELSNFILNDRETEPDRSWVRTISWSPDGKSLAVVPGSSTQNLIWEIEGNKIRELPIFSNHVNDIAWSPDGRKLAHNSDNKIYILEVSSFDLLKMIETGQYGGEWFLDWMPDSKHLISGGNGNLLALWNAENGQLLYEVTSHID